MNYLDVKILFLKKKLAVFEAKQGKSTLIALTITCILVSKSVIFTQRMNFKHALNLLKDVINGQYNLLGKYLVENVG